MEVKIIRKIKETGILQALNSANVPIPDNEFKKINLIFGWNGTGKTTLSRIFRCYELGRKCEKLVKYDKCETEIELFSGVSLKETDFNTKQQIRVFNKDFVDENIFQDKDVDGGNVNAIYYLGSEKIELTKERKEKDSKKALHLKLTKGLDVDQKKKEKFEQDTAKSIKDTLLGIKSFQHYFKDKFVKTFESLRDLILQGKKLSDFVIPETEFEQKLRTVKNYDALTDWIAEIKSASNKINGPYLADLNTEVLGKTVTLQKLIERLRDDWELSRWVQEGLRIHKDRKVHKCEFCQQDLPSHRIEDLEKHFNDDYTNLVKSVRDKLDELQSLKINNVSKIPNNETKEMAQKLNQKIDILIAKVKAKQINILTEHSIPDTEVSELIADFSSITASSDKILETMSGVAEELEKSLVAEHYEAYASMLSKIESANEEKGTLEKEIAELNIKIKEGERSVRDFNIPAHEINSDIEKFLGHSELKFEAKEDEHKEVYYEITRNGDTAFNLSEGEKTAISLIYFLKKLNEDGFDQKNGLVFIDDPISSMDSQFMYASYAYIVSAIEDDTGTNLTVGQFILSTHNFDFFTLFKKKYWKSKEPVKRRCQVYMLKVELDSVKQRCSNIHPLDSLLKDFDSDYQYLYSLLLGFEKATEDEKKDLKRIYPYPNISRRVLETFLSFKYPARKDLQGKFNAISHPDITKEVKESVYRFINIKSHGTLREAEGFAPEVINPDAKNQIQSVLTIMRILDKQHCDGMET